ncbi:hypothetical protein OKA04_14240 [Luteolibacter flavescens]|uniref:Lipoprotein n=1 Tax=Luteolibacter flavescens TaxID=1859460 RepID=A0ABT3FSD9_9BACT|nr:hypothetical protein [Luteolibacter flavescens]MCW1885895.1 hypothetical protein [Luteolibacter flavescens]
MLFCEGKVNRSQAKNLLLTMGLLSSLLGSFGCSKDAGEAVAPDSQVSVTAQFNHKIGPMDRGERYEEPLDEVLRARGYGSTDGGGTMQSKEGEIEFIDVHMVLSSPEESIPFVAEFLEGRGAPKGSKIRVFDGDKMIREIPFGVREGFAIYLDGVNLPDDVYEESDINVVIAEIDARLKGHGEIESHWQGPTETALYIYGDSINVMKPLIKDFMDQYPLCKGARVADMAPK